LIYLVYQFIFHFIIPVYKTTQQVKRSFREMHNRMNGAASENQSPPPQQAQSPAGGGKKSAEDYIDFEEIK